MAQRIASSLSTANTKSQTLLRGLEGFVTLRCSHVAPPSAGRPAWAHDQNIACLRKALASYKTSQTRDAKALQQMAQEFNAADRLMAARLLGFTY
jgi:hypothetical protein